MIDDARFAPLPSEEEGAQAGDIILGHELGVRVGSAHGSKGGWRGKEAVDLVLLDDCVKTCQQMVSRWKHCVTHCSRTRQRRAEWLQVQAESAHGEEEGSRAATHACPRK